MDERGSESGRLMAAVFIALIALLSLGALYIPRFEQAPVRSRVVTSARPVMPAVELWLSTEDRRL